VYFVAKEDPLVHLFAWLTTAGGLGVLILMWAASAAVIAFFLRHPSRENRWRTQIAPVIAFLLLSVVLAATVIGLGDLLQVSGNSPFRWLFPTGYLIFTLLGFAWALIMRSARPDVFAAIGRGADGRVAAASTVSMQRQATSAEAITVRGIYGG
jgi:hypothetical protein